jgi:hypothetical protein
MLSKAVLNLNQREYYISLSYIVISWVKILLGVLFEVLFDFDRFKPVNSAILVDREIDYIIKTNQLL